ncbi:MAG: DUF4908 domain-containing protein [Pseudomonadota bacterium]
MRDLVAVMSPLRSALLIALVASFAAFSGAWAADKSTPQTRAQPTPDDLLSNLVGRPYASRSAAALGRNPRILVGGDGAPRLLFDSRGAVARARFHCARPARDVGCLGVEAAWSDEIITLYGRPGARADMIYATSDEAIRIRVADGRHATLYARGSVGGEPLFLAAGYKAQVTGVGPVLHLGPAGPIEAQRAASLAQARLRQHLGSAFTLDIGETPDGVDHSVLVDAVNVAFAGVHAALGRPGVRRSLRANLKGVRFIASDAPVLEMQDGVLIVHYAPGSGVAGRPPSASVRSFLERSV